MTPPGVNRALGAGMWALLLVVAMVPWALPERLPDSLEAMRPDNAFMMAQSEIQRLGLQFGRDTIWTYGPLGFLLFDLCLVRPELLTWVVIGRVGLALVFGWGMARVVAVGVKGRLGTIAAWTVLAVFVVLSTNGRSAGYWLAFTLIAIWLEAFDEEGSLGARYVNAAAAGLVATLKGTHVLFGIAAFGVAGTLALVRRRPPATAGIFAATFVVSWWAAGQSPFNIPAYLRQTLDLSSGYGEAMAKGFATPYHFVDVVLFTTASVPALLLVLWSLRRADGHRASRVALLGTLAVLTVLTNKHAWGGNQLGNGTSTLVLQTLLVGATVSATRVGTLVLALTVASSGVLWLRNDLWAAELARRPLGALWEHRAKALAFVRLPLDGLAPHRERSAILHDRVRRWSALPGALEGTIDSMGDLPILATTHPRLRYHPRPMYMSLNAHTEALARSNAAFLEGPDAPDYLVVDVASLPGQFPYDRYPSLSDGPAWLAMLTRYDPVGFAGTRPLLERRAGALAHHLDDLSAADVAWGEWVEVPDAGFVWAALSMPLSAVGRIVEGAFKAPRLLIEIERADGEHQTYRLVDRMARAGFLLSPLVPDGIEFTDAALALREARPLAPAVRVRRFRLLEEHDGPPLRTARPQVVLTRLVLTSTAATIPAAFEPVRRLLALRRGVRASLFPAYVDVRPDGSLTLAVHAPARLELEVPAGARRVRVSYGLRPTAFADATHAADGVDFRVVDESGAALHTRSVAPDDAAASRDVQHAIVDLPPATRRIVLEASPGAAGHVAYDHAFWSDAEFLFDGT